MYLKEIEYRAWIGLIWLKIEKICAFLKYGKERLDSIKRVEYFG